MVEAVSESGLGEMQVLGTRRRSGVEMVFHWGDRLVYYPIYVFSGPALM